MAKISSREKNLAVVVVLVVAAMSIQRMKREQRTELLNAQGEVASAKERVNQSRALMASLPKAAADEPDRRPAAMNDMTMRMMKDVTLPVEVKGIRVVSVDHPTPGEYKMVVEGRFGGIMKFISYLERPEGDFRLNHIDLAKSEEKPKEGEAPEESRDLRGTFTLVRRG